MLLPVGSTMLYFFLLQEYMRKLGKCLLALQHDQHGGARPLLDLWVAEAIALICCVRVYSPEFLKVIDSSAMDGSQNTRLSKPALEQHMVGALLLNALPTVPACVARTCRAFLYWHALALASWLK